MNAQEIARIQSQHADKLAEAEAGFQGMLSRSTTDPEFRRKLIEDPRAAVAEWTGREPSANFDVAFIENKGGATIVLPDPVDPDAEISEEELETVAGGISPALGVIASVLAVYDAWFD